MKYTSLRTRAIHAGESARAPGGAVAPPLHMANSYMTEADLSFSAERLTPDSPYIYTRWGNPTVSMLEKRVASLEGSEEGLCFSSGMAAITGLFTHLLGTGDHLVMSDVAYAGAVEYTYDLLPQMGVAVTHVDVSDLDAVRDALRPNTRLVHIETPCNPILRLADIEQIARLAHGVGALLSVDSTFASPVITRPLMLGAGLVIHSLTKYLGGHGDALGGIIVGRSELLARIRSRVGIHAGGILSPFNAWLILRGLTTLPLRMQAHCDSAMHIAAMLTQHPRVKRVIYPGLDSHPQYRLAQKQMRLPGGMLTFQADDGEKMARQLQRRLQLVSYAVSLGHVHSLIYYNGTDSIMESTFHLRGGGLTAYKDYAGEVFSAFLWGWRIPMICAATWHRRWANAWRRRTLNAQPLQWCLAGRCLSRLPPGAGSLLLLRSLAGSAGCPATA